MEDPRYDYLYPLLQEWAWDRSACVERIRAEGLPVPVKSSCVICAYLRPEELMALPRWVLRLIVLVEARAAPRLRNVEGLWRRGTKARPGSMTAFIRQRLLLDPAEIDAIIAGTPVDLIDFQRVAAAIPVDRRPHMREWIDRFNEGVEKLAA